MVDVTIGPITPDFIIQFDKILKSIVMLPEWTDNPARVDTTVWNTEVIQLEYTFRATDSEKWAADQMLLAHTKVAFSDNIHRISGLVWVTKLEANYTPNNWVKPWEVKITLISDNLTTFDTMNYFLDVNLCKARKYGFDVNLVTDVLYWSNDCEDKNSPWEGTGLSHISIASGAPHGTYWHHYSSSSDENWDYPASVSVNQNDVWLKFYVKVHALYGNHVVLYFEFNGTNLNAGLWIDYSSPNLRFRPVVNGSASSGYFSFNYDTLYEIKLHAHKSGNTTTLDLYVNGSYVCSETAMGIADFNTFNKFQVFNVGNNDFYYDWLRVGNTGT